MSTGTFRGGATLLALGWAASIAAAPPTDSARDYDVLLDRHRTGTVHETVSVLGNRVTTRSEQSLRLDRAGHPLETHSTAVSEEHGGALRSLRVDTALAGEVFGFTAGVNGRQLHRTPIPVDARFAVDLRLDRELLGPEGLRQATLTRLHRAGDALQYGELDEDTGEPVEVTRRLLDDRDGDAPFRVADETASERRRVVSTLDAEGVLMEAEEDTPLGHLTMRRMAAPLDEPLTGAPIALAARLEADVALPDPRAVDGLSLRLRRTDEPLDPADFAGPGQTAVSTAEGGIALTTRRVGSDPASGEPPGPQERGANAFFTSDAPPIRALAHRLGAATRSDDARIERVVRYVHETLQFDPGIAVGTPLDVLARRRGTCVAYAALTATLLRSLGYPARSVYGYAYADGAFVGHAWTEVWVHRRWRAVDAALAPGPAADAARVALARSDGHAGPASGLDRLARTLGRFTVAIESYTVRGTVHSVRPQDTAPQGP